MKPDHLWQLSDHDTHQEGADSLPSAPGKDPEATTLTRNATPFLQHAVAQRERKEEDESEGAAAWNSESPLKSEEASNWAVAEIITLTLDCKFN